MIQLLFRTILDGVKLVGKKKFESAKFYQTVFSEKQKSISPIKENLKCMCTDRSYFTKKTHFGQQKPKNYDFIYSNSIAFDQSTKGKVCAKIESNKLRERTKSQNR